MENEILKSIEEVAADNSFAIGNDLVFVPDFKNSLTDLFKQRVYTPAEIDYCEQFNDSTLRFASTWAAKEAVYKALKQIIHVPMGWKGIEITRDKTAGRPRVTVHHCEANFPISLTLSHDGDYVWAVAFIDTKNGTA